jgi:SSS family solute:Na+ symporter
MFSSHWLDLLIVALYMGGIAVFGLRFARRQTSTERYFVAQRSIPGWAMGISLFAAISSSLSFIGYPGSAYAGNWNDLVQGLMVIPALVVAVAIAVPFYRRVVGVSAYEYFGKRFGYGARVYSSLAFSFAHFSKLAFVFYLVTLTVHIMIGTNMYLTTIVLGVVTITYTCVGGLEAVIWTDVIHACTAFVGVLICVGFLLFLPPGGPSAAFRLAWENHKFSLGSFDFNLSQKGFWPMALYGLFWYLQKYTTDQTVVQRYLAAKSDSQAAKGTALGMSICLVVWTFFMFIGSMLWSYFQLTKEQLPARITKADHVFPYFLSAHLPPGCMGLFMAALTASAMSMVSSDLNCLSSIGVEDFYRRFRPDASDAQQLRVGKILVTICGILTVMITLVLARYTEHALSLYFTITAILSGGLFGLFVLAFFSRRANLHGVWVGVIACVLFTAYATLTSPDGKILDLGRFNFPWRGVMIGVVGHLVLMGVGYVASLACPTGAKVAEDLTVWGWLERRRARRPD